MKLSRNRQLCCSGAELATRRDDKDKLQVVIILDILYYASKCQKNEFVKLIMGSTGVDTYVQASNHGSSYVWGYFPAEAVNDLNLNIALQVILDNKVHDELFIGIVQPSPIPRKTTRKKSASNSMRQVDSSLERRMAASADLQLAQELFHGPVALAGYTKLQFELLGDLLDAQKNWTEAEKRAGRRLVWFKRAQLGAAVRLESAIAETAPESKSPSVVISCIQWPNEPGYFFVTSFDVIRLLEFALQTRMTTEVKNRARRNMASVTSITLPRVKLLNVAETDFQNDPYSLVMSFESPKPRSIEKSLKVFEWGNLEQCMYKVLSRFVLRLPNADIPSKATIFEHILDVEKRITRKNRRSGVNKLAGRDTLRQSADYVYRDSPDIGCDEKYTEETNDVKKERSPPMPVIAHAFGNITWGSTSGLRRPAESTVCTIHPEVKRRRIISEEGALEPIVKVETSAPGSPSTLYSISSGRRSTPELDFQVIMKNPVMTNATPQYSSPDPLVMQPTAILHPLAYHHSLGSSIVPGQLSPPILTTRMVRTPPPYITNPTASTTGGAIIFPFTATASRFLVAPMLAPQSIRLGELSFLTSGGLLGEAQETNFSNEIDTDEWLDNDYIMALEKEV
ncbi:hypothetical protein PIIN_04391 [Serendipita indica DSM 11827]|uniref:DUF7082 domain-containing protein n=1 Tax=Serendipita indica (strain DSM 11827) TaxID=1109443 RepID=G4TGK4_SERID|nr:hypothetical protein PIIN_04391 [Serendipita indica DSM 11827]